MVRSRAAVAVILMLIPLLSLPAHGYAEKDQTVVNIENFKFFRIDIGDDEKVRIDARIEALSYPVSVLLIKGQEEFDKFVASDSVNVDDIKSGNITEFDDSFIVIRDFSERETELFERSITIGEEDVYYLVVMLYRDSTMDPDEVLTVRATIVNYDVEWRAVENRLDYPLLAIAIAIAFVGTALIAYYFWPRRKEEPSELPKAPRYAPARRGPRSRL
jgi:hypothetical protein